jgi:hypothetical protein
VPLVQVASIEESDEPDQIGRANSRRRSVIAANSDGSDMAAIIEQIRTVLANNPLADGYFVSLEGQFQAQKAASRQPADCQPGAGVPSVDFYTALQQLQVGGIGCAGYGQYPLGAYWPRNGHMAGTHVAIGGRLVRFYHPDRDSHRQWHFESQPLHQPVQIRSRALRPGKAAWQFRVVLK